jgi:hypothetical protein
MSIIRNCAVGLVICAVFLLSLVAASVIVMSVEMLADLVAQAGVPAMLDLVIAGAIGWVLFRRISTRRGMGFQSESGPVSGGEPAIGVQPG